MLFIHDEDGIALDVEATDIVLAAFRNGQAMALPSCTKTSPSAGAWALQFTSGFPSTGLWYIRLIVVGRVYYEELRVSSEDIDSVALAIAGLGSGSGTWAITISAIDADASPLPDVRVTVLPEEGTLQVAAVRTNSGGGATLLLDAGTWRVRAWTPGYQFEEQTLVVSSDDTLALTGTTLTVSPPDDPSLCRLYAWFRDMSGAPTAGVSVTFQNLQNPLVHEGGIHIAETQRTAVSDEDGYLEFDAVRGLTLQIMFIGSRFGRQIIVPDEDTANLLTLAGVYSDAFAITPR